MRFAVIDIGSNSIKLLVAESSLRNALEVIHQTTIESRISKGISQDVSVLTKDSIVRGITAVKSLYDLAKQYKPEDFCLVATSAVRDATNRDAFIEGIFKETGEKLKILSGEQEAAYIAKGISTDPALKEHKEFCLADLGGGSLELIHIRECEILDKHSLPLGAVRLSERCINDTHKPMRISEMKAVALAVRDEIRKSGLRFPASSGILAGTGGGITVARAIRSKWLGQDFDNVGNMVSLTFLRYLFIELATMTLEERMSVPELPQARADIMPTALLTLINVAEIAGASNYIHSMHNLRFGIAASLFEGAEIESIAG